MLQGPLKGKGYRPICESCFSGPSEEESQNLCLALERAGIFTKPGERQIEVLYSLDSSTASQSDSWLPTVHGCLTTVY